MRTPTAASSLPRRQFLRALGLVAAGAVALDACAGATTIGTAAVDDSLTSWLAQRPFFVAHRGGDADWVQCTAAAYRHAAAWNPSLALEVPVWATADGVWVVSESPNTTAVFGADHNIPATRWSTLSRLRSTTGHLPMARLVDDVLTPYASKRVLFIDNKSDNQASTLLTELGRHGGPRRIVMKSYWQSDATPAAARRAGYTTWGYYYARELRQFAATQGRFDLLGLDYTAPRADFRMMLATGKPVIAHVVATQAAAGEAFGKGTTGLMVSGVTEVVPRHR